MVVLPDVSVVIPALNEEASIGICVSKAFRALEALGMAGEVVVVDNGSTDGTARIASECGARVVPVATRGYGSALMGGFASARGRYLIMGDADDSYNFEEIGPYVEKLQQGFDFVVGNRFQGRIETGASPFLHRYLGTPVLSFVSNLFFHSGVGDTNCGLRGLTRDAFERMHLRSPGMEFATEMIIKASVLGMKITEVPCNLYRDKRGRRPHLNTWADGWRHLRFMLLFSPKWTYVVPGSLFVLTGFLGMIVLGVRDSLATDALPWLSTKHAFSFMALLVLGAQILEFGLAALVFGYSQYFDHSNPVVQFLTGHFRLEKGVLTAFAMGALGVLIFAYLATSYYWGIFPRHSDALRLDIAALGIAFLIISVQVGYTSFLLSLFQLKLK